MKRLHLVIIVMDFLLSVFLLLLAILEPLSSNKLAQSVSNGSRVRVAYQVTHGNVYTWILDDKNHQLSWFIGEQCMNRLITFFFLLIIGSTRCIQWVSSWEGIPKLWSCSLRRVWHCIRGENLVPALGSLFYWNWNWAITCVLSFRQLSGGLWTEQFYRLRTH